MLRQYFLRRLTLLFFMMALLSAFTFSLSYFFPGDVAENLSGRANSSFSDADEINQAYKLDKSVLTQYVNFVRLRLDGDWGLSLASGQPVAEHISSLFPATLELSLYALIFAIIVGIPSGIIAANFYKKWPDKLISNLALIGYSTPVFWLALVLIMIVSLQLSMLPMSGRISLLYEIPQNTGFLLYDIAVSTLPYKASAFTDALAHLALPTLVLATYPTSVLTRFTRDAMLEVLEKPYIKSAKAKGLTRQQIIFKHALRNALLPVIKQIGPQFSTLITLAMITEVIFSWPGLGAWLIDSIYQRDYPAISGGLLAVSLFVILANILADIIHILLDPVSRNQTHGKI